MAKTSTPDLQDALDESWETVSTGIGEEYDAEKDGPLVANFLGTTSKEIVDTEKESGKRDQSLHQFAPKDAPDEVRFIWGSYELDAAMSKVTQGQMCRITFTGRSSFSSKAGPRQIKHYKVQVQS